MIKFSKLIDADTEAWELTGLTAKGRFLANRLYDEFELEGASEYRKVYTYETLRLLADIVWDYMKEIDEKANKAYNAVKEAFDDLKEQDERLEVEENEGHAV